MEQNNNYQSFAESFEQDSSDHLVENFNRQVGNRGFTSARGASDIALINEFVRR